jgi:hypothetical protein
MIVGSRRQGKKLLKAATALVLYLEIIFRSDIEVNFVKVPFIAFLK